MNLYVSRNLYVPLRVVRALITLVSHVITSLTVLITSVISVITAGGRQMPRATARAGALGQSPRARPFGRPRPWPRPLFFGPGPWQVGWPWPRPRHFFLGPGPWALYMGVPGFYFSLLLSGSWPYVFLFGKREVDLPPCKVGLPEKNGQGVPFQVL